MSNNGKDLLQSRTFWGSLMMVVSLLLKQLGIEIDAAVWTNDIVALVGAGLALYGRVKATKPVHTVAGVKIRRKVEDEEVDV